MAGEVLHVVVLPWSAFGHMIPFFELSVALAKSRVKVSFISTPKNIQRLPKLAPDLAALINFVEFPLPCLDCEILPQGAEATVDVPFEKVQYLKAAYDLLQHPFKKFIADESPDWIISDILSHWVVEISQDHGVPLLNFSVFSASAYAFFAPESLVGGGKKGIRTSPESLTLVPDWVDFQSPLAYRRFEANGSYDGYFESNATGITDAQRVAKIVHASQAVAVRTCPEFEGDYLNLLNKIMGRPVIPVGLLTPDTDTAKGREHHQITDDAGPWIEIFKWLDEQKPRSVVFVGFGSECKLSKDQVYEIACGLELSGLPFLLTLRKPEWATNDVDALPLGFCNRTRGKGVVGIGWTPQMEILGHPSIGGSLGHAGWGSVVETLQFGHPLIVLPFVVDQPLNARILVEKGLALEVERKEDGSFTRDDISKALRTVMVSEEGEKIKIRARQTGVLFKDKKLHEHHFGKFVEYLKNNAVKK